MLLRCSAVLDHHVSDSSQLGIGSQSLIAVTESCLYTPSTALDASVISHKVRIEVTGASVPTLSALGWTTATLSGDF